MYVLHIDHVDAMQLVLKPVLGVDLVSVMILQEVSIESWGDF